MAASSWAGRGSNPRLFPGYKPGALTSELPACRSEKRHRPPDLSVMSGALWPTELSRHGGQPRSRTWQLTAYQTVPFTGWVVARVCGSGCGRSRNLQGHEAHPGSGWVPSASRIADPCAEQAGFAPTRRLPPLACFGTGAVGLSASRSNAESERFELPGRSSRPTPLPTVPLVPSGHSPRAEGEGIERPRDSRPDLRLATGCLTTLGQPSNVPQEGFGPSRPCGLGLLRPARLPVPPPGLGVADET